MPVRVPAIPYCKPFFSYIGFCASKVSSLRKLTRTAAFETGQIRSIPYRLCRYRPSGRSCTQRMVRSIFECPAGRSLSFSGISPNRGTPGIFFLRRFSLRSFSASCALIASCSRCMASSAFCSFDLITMGCTPVSSILCDGGVTICGFFKVAATRGRTWSLGRGWMTSCRVSFSCSFSKRFVSVFCPVPCPVPRPIPCLVTFPISCFIFGPGSFLPVIKVSRSPEFFCSELCALQSISFCFSSGRGSAISPVSSSRYNTQSSWSALVAAT